MKAFRNIASLILILSVGFIQPTSSQTGKKFWIFFTDKGNEYPKSGSLYRTSTAYQEALRYISPRALARRAKILPKNDLLDAADLPVNESYIREIENVGGILAQKSRWLNAASFILTPDQISKANNLRFVSKIQPVVIFHDRKMIETPVVTDQSIQKIGSMDYGQSYTQDQMINVPALHSAGITGKGVLVGMLDSGFRWKVHEALKDRHVIAEHDFVFNDDVTANQTGDAVNQDTHGTLTFSVIGGFKPGKLIGVAYDADFILGKTEYIPTETKQEEDNWAAGIEWMESYGVDVVSSSLGYNDFDPQGPSPEDYTWANGDFNGRTSITAKAAARAARLGVVVCTAMGNEGNGTGTVGTLLTPADADSIISVGAVTFNRTLWYLSSTGPTNDNRIKPEVVAPGVGIHHASVPGPDTYGASSGTSLATPLAAGIAALVLSVRPELMPMQVRYALQSSADTINYTTYPIRPNNFIGSGLVNAFNAALTFGPIFSNEPTVSLESNSNVVTIDVNSKFGIKPDSVIFYFAAGAESTYSSVSMQLSQSANFPTSGKYSISVPIHPFGTHIRCYITATDSAGNSYSSPPSITKKQWHFTYGVPGLDTTSHVLTNHVLNQNYPNPLRGPITNIPFELINDEHVIIKVYNLLGQGIATIANGIYTKGPHSIIWDASDCPIGVYFYRLTTPSFSATKKMIYTR